MCLCWIRAQTDNTAHPCLHTNALTKVLRESTRDTADIQAIIPHHSVSAHLFAHQQNGTTSNVFKHKDRDKVRARTTKNQEHVDSIKTKNKQKNNTTDLETDLTRQDKTDNKARESAQQTGKHMGVQTGQEMGGNTERMRIAALLNLEEIFFIFFSCLSSIKWCLNKAARWYLTLEEINFESSCQKWCQSPQQKQRGKKGFSFPKTCLGYKHRPPWLTKTAEVNRNTHTHQKKKKFLQREKKTNKKYSLVNLLLANPQRAYRAQ